MRNKSNRANNLFQLDGGTSHHGVDNDDNNENTNRPPKPPYPDGLEETDNQEPEETNETDASVGESYDAMWKRAAAGESDDTSEEDNEIYSVCSSQSERDMGS